MRGWLTIYPRKPLWFHARTFANQIRVRAQDRHGKNIKIEAKGWTARIFQHEIDHLNGVLYIDQLTDRENFWTEAEFEAMLAESDEEEETIPEM